jgi:hypothetical protein
VVTVVAGIVTRTVELAIVTAEAVVKKVTVAVGVGMAKQLQASETCEHVDCLSSGDALAQAPGDAGIEAEGFAVVDDLADDTLGEVGLKLEVTRAALIATAPQTPGTIALRLVSMNRSSLKITYDIVAVSVTTSAVRVVVQTIVVTAEVSTVVDVVVPETSVFATEVVAKVLVTIAVGIVAIGAPFRLFTIAEMSWYSSCFNWLRSRASSATEVALPTTAEREQSMKAS